MDLSDLSAVYEAEGPFVTVHFAIPSKTEDAAQQLEVRWKDLVRELDELGVDEQTREALTEARGGHEPGQSRLLVAAGGEVLLVESLPDAPAHDSARLDALPHLLPVVHGRGMDLRHILVVTDRQGADITVHAPGAELADEVKGGRIWKQGTTGAPGRGERKHLNRVEQSWEKNAEAVAERVEVFAKTLKPDVIILAGDTRAVEMLQRDLPGSMQPLVAVVQGTRHADGSEELLEQHVRDQLEKRRLDELRELLAKYAEERGQDDLAADGADATVGALRMAQVDTLLLAETVDQERGGYFGPDLTLLALDRQELLDLGVEQPQAAPLVQILIRAAVGTAADVRTLPADLGGDGPTEGIGALLRFATPSG